MMKKILLIISARIAGGARRLVLITGRMLAYAAALARFLGGLLLRLIKQALSVAFILLTYAVLLAIRIMIKAKAAAAILYARQARWLRVLGREARTSLAIGASYVGGILSRRLVNRTLALLLVTAACVLGFLSIRGALPFMPVFGNSMEPELKAGNLILIEETSAYDVKVGDVIAFSIPEMVREHYNYPPVIAHRVVEVYDREGTVLFRTKGDNTGEDPFTVRPQDLMGKVTRQIPYLGFPLLFFQSQQGLIFVVTFLALLALYLYADEIGKGRRWVQRGVFSPVIKESQRSSRALENRIGESEKTMAGTQQALSSFAAAIAEYAEHLKSHTSAIQGLSDASQELKKGAVEQNKVLAGMMEVLRQQGPAIKAPEAKTEEARPEAPGEKPKTDKKYPPGCFKSQRPSVENK